MVVIWVILCQVSTEMSLQIWLKKVFRHQTWEPRLTLCWYMPIASMGLAYLPTFVPLTKQLKVGKYTTFGCWYDFTYYGRTVSAVIWMFFFRPAVVMPTTGSRGSRNQDKSREIYDVYIRFGFLSSAFCIMNHDPTKHCPLHYTVSTYYINDCQWCLKWKAWTCPQLCSVRFPWPTRQEISFFFFYEDLFWIILGWHFMRFLRCSAHTWDAIPLFLLFWLTGNWVKLSSI